MSRTHRNWGRNRLQGHLWDERLVESQSLSKTDAQDRAVKEAGRLATKATDRESRLGLGCSSAPPISSRGDVSAARAFSLRTVASFTIRLSRAASKGASSRFGTAVLGAPPSAGPPPHQSDAPLLSACTQVWKHLFCP